MSVIITIVDVFKIFNFYKYCTILYERMLFFMKYSKEFRENVRNAYSRTVCPVSLDSMPNDEIFKFLRETEGKEIDDDVNVQFGQMLMIGASLQKYITPEEILNYLNRLEIKALEMYATAAILRRNVYYEWLNTYGKKKTSFGPAKTGDIPLPNIPLRK